MNLKNIIDKLFALGLISFVLFGIVQAVLMQDRRSLLKCDSAQVHSDSAFDQETITGYYLVDLNAQEVQNYDLSQKIGTKINYTHFYGDNTAQWSIYYDPENSRDQIKFKLNYESGELKISKFVSQQGGNQAVTEIIIPCKKVALDA